MSCGQITNASLTLRWQCKHSNSGRREGADVLREQQGRTSDAVRFKHSHSDAAMTQAARADRRTRWGRPPLGASVSQSATSHVIASSVLTCAGSRVPNMTGRLSVLWGLLAPGRPWLWPYAAVLPVCLLAACATTGSAPRQPASGSPLSPQSLQWLDRVTWGPNSAMARDLNELGEERFLEKQLRPVEALPASVRDQIAGLSIAQQPLDRVVIQLEQQRKEADAITDDEGKKAAQGAYQLALTRLANEAASRSLLRDLYSPNQLQEQMTWFWVNHFNVFIHKGNLRAMIGDFEERAIRPHALGRFRDLLMATMRHPAMLRYLDNEQNAAGHINENYARELMELHTLGVNGGYTQRDVQELARVLTGLGINASDQAPGLRAELKAQYVRNGLFEFNPNRHDYGDKELLGRRISGRGLPEIDEVADLLSRHPSTAQFVSRKLAVYFVADDPPKPLVEGMAATFRSSDHSL